MQNQKKTLAAQSKQPRIGIVMPTHNNAEDVRNCLASLAQSAYRNFRVVVVDNASTDETVAVVRSNFPETTVIEEKRNLGYAGGVVRGWQELRKHPVDYLFILTQDIVLDKDWAQPLIDYLENNKNAAAAQPLLLYQDDRERVNSAGNVVHFLGFGYTYGDGLSLKDEAIRERLAMPALVPYASGGALMLRAALFEKIGLVQENFFMYHEDLDLGWRIRLAGYQSVFVPTSRAYHRYDFHRSTMIKYEFGERNRLLVLLENYHWLTLLLIFPAWFVMEIAVVAFSLKNGWFRQKVRGYWYIIREWPSIMKTRAEHQALRRETERRVVRDFSGSIVFQNDPTALLFLANPFFEAYWAIVRRLIVW